MSNFFESVKKAIQIPALAHVYALDLDRKLKYAGKKPITFSAFGFSESPVELLDNLDESIFLRADALPQNAIYQAEMLVKEGKRSEALAHAFSHAQGLQIHALNLFYANYATERPELRLHYLNKYLSAHGLRIDLAPDEASPFFHRLRCNHPSNKVDGPLVTVIMPAHNAEGTIELAVDSLLNQTWQNLQIIVVDDASTDGTLQKAKDLAKRDPRVEVHSSSDNVGPYVCRNLGVLHTRGQWLTVHEADDWAFPDRIEQQFKALTAANALACTGCMLRMNEQGQITRPIASVSTAQDGYLRLYFASLMVQTAYFRNVLGAWDSVRVGGDAELIERLKVLAAPNKHLRRPLILCLDHQADLTGHHDLGPVNETSQIEALSVDYNKASKAWHKASGSKKLSTFGKARPFEVPKANVVDQVSIKKVFTAWIKNLESTKASELFGAAWHRSPYPGVEHTGLQAVEHDAKTAVPTGQQPVAVRPEPLKLGAKASQVLGLPVLRQDCYQDYVEISKKRDKGHALDATALRTRSYEIRRIFAWLALDKTGTLEHLLSELEAYRDPARPASPIPLERRLNTVWSLRMARIMALQSICPDDRLNSYTLLKILFESRTRKKFTPEHAKLMFDLALEMGEPQTAVAIADSGIISDDVLEYSRTDLANPLLTGGVSSKAWLDQFNAIFLRSGVEPVQLQDFHAPVGSPHAFDRLHSECSERIDSDLKISVVVSVWKPDAGLITSVRSILNQSWKNLEVLLIDDCCSDEYREIIDFCVQLDTKRIRCFRQAVNQGTYMARNLALQVATGQFMTFQDADDWSHPRRLELQIRPLLDDPSLIATTSRTARVRETLMFSYLGYPVPVRLNTSSLMFRIAPAKQKLGSFDAVRKGADSEFLKRIQVVFGKNAYKPLQPVLSLVRLGEDSLSRSDFRAGWHHPAREAYRAAFTYWHEEIQRGTRSAHILPDDKKRPFPAPAAFEITRGQDGGPKPRSYDVVFVSDWRGDGGPQNSMIQEIAALKAQGYSVAICHMEALRFMTSRMELLSPRIQALINSGDVDQVTLLDDVETTLLLMRYPLILQFPPDLQSKIRARHAIMVVNQAPHESDGSDQRYEVHDCIRNARKLFATDPIWAPQGPLVRDIIAPLLPKALLASLDLTGFVDPSHWRMMRKPLSGARPVIGRYSRDDAMKFPENRDMLLACYPATGSCDVRIMGGTKTCLKLLGTDGLPANWTMLEHRQIPTRDFLEDIDFFVHFDNSNIVEAFGRSLLEAIASGRVTILPEKFRRVFGNAAIYCKPEEVESVVHSLWNAPDAYRKQSETARRVVEEKFSETAFLRNLFELAPALGNANDRVRM